MEIMQLKEELVKQLFEVRVNKDVDPIEHKVVVIEPMLAINASKLANKLNGKVEKEELYAQYMASAWRRFKISNRKRTHPGRLSSISSI
jgi:hypothetical protein